MNYQEERNKGLVWLLLIIGAGYPFPVATIYSGCFSVFEVGECFKISQQPGSSFRMSNHFCVGMTEFSFVIFSTLNISCT
jgi:hypothetical protein